MPAVHFDIEWPDGEVTTHYSPSTVVREHFPAGRRLTVIQLLSESNKALTLAGDKVEAKFGFRCTSAEETLSQISERSGAFDMDGEVTIRRIT